MGPIEQKYLKLKTLKIFRDFLNFFLSLDISQSPNTFYGQHAKSSYIRNEKCVQEKIIIENESKSNIFISSFTLIHFFKSSPRKADPGGEGMRGNSGSLYISLILLHSMLPMSPHPLFYHYFWPKYDKMSWKIASRLTVHPPLPQW